MDTSFAELFNILFFAAISLLAWFLPLSLHRRISASVLGVLGIAVCLFMAHSSAHLTVQTSHHLRTWMPLLLILLAYHQSGRLFNKPWKRFESFLLELDRRLLGRLVRGPGAAKIHPLLSGYFEASYLACYALVPAALAALMLMGRHYGIEKFWMVVLPSTYVCYALIPLFPALPPRLLNTDPEMQVHPIGIRALNLWILKYASIRANTFPSAHVAACMSSSLVVFQHDVWAGTAFLWISVSIAAGAVVRRYHYLADVVLGIILPFIFLFGK
jgi:hypothetical protein